MQEIHEIQSLRTTISGKKNYFFAAARKSMVLGPQKSSRAHIWTAFTTRMIFLIFVFFLARPPYNSVTGKTERVCDRKSWFWSKFNILARFSEFLYRLYPPSPGAGAGGGEVVVAEPQKITKIKSIILVVNAVQIWALDDFYELRYIDFRAPAKK